MCDMQKMPAPGDAPCEEDSEMNFATFSAVGGAGTHFVTANGHQIPIAKIQQNTANNGAGMPQIVSMVSGDGVQYVRHMDGSMSTPQLISVPIALPNAKPGDPQPTVQIQVLGPNLLQQQQPKYHMQIPIQGFQQAGAVLTVAYSPENGDNGGIQLLGNSLPEGLQVLAALPQEMQLMQPSQAQIQQENKDQVQQQLFITQNHQIVINNGQDNKIMLNNNNNEPEVTDIVIKEEESEDNNCDDESSQGAEASDTKSWQISAAGHQDLVKYLNQLPPQQTQALPASLQQFLRLNPSDVKTDIEIEVPASEMAEDKSEPVAVAVIEQDGVVRIQCKKKKKYKKKPPKPARPKPGQVVIATASDGTLIYCCPECEMAYPDKEQLENHLPAHKIERRFICGICGAGLKRKEHLERHKLGHNPDRPYVCGVCRKGFKRREHLNLHTVIHSGVKTEMCQECGKGFYRKDHLRKHTRSHESKRAREEANSENKQLNKHFEANASGMRAATESMVTEGVSDNSIPEITIHVPMDYLKVPTSAHSRVPPVQINIPAHMMSSLQSPLNDAIESILPDSS